MQVETIKSYIFSNSKQQQGDNLGEKQRHFLLTTCINYLKSMTSSNTHSEHSCKSYAVDIAQLMNLVRIGKIRINFSTLPAQVRWIPQEKSLIHCEALPQMELNSHSLKALIHALKSKWASLEPSSQARKYSAIRGYLSWLRTQKILTDDLSIYLVSPKTATKIPNFLSFDEILSLIKHLITQKRQLHHSTKEHCAAVEDLLLVILLYAGGLRISEALQLRWDQVDLDRKQLLIRGKGQKERIVILPNSCFEFLAQLPNKQIQLFGFRSNRQAFARLRRRGQEVSLLKPLSPHMLRHSYATHLLNSGLNLRLIQELLGHQSLVSTQIYTHLAQDDLARTIEKHHPLGQDLMKLKNP